MAEENSSAIRQFPCACFYSVCGSFRPMSKLTASSVCCPKLSRTMNRTSAFLSDRLRYHRVNTCRIGSLRSIPAYRPAHGTRGLPAASPRRPSLRLCPSSGCTRCNTPHRGNLPPLSVSGGSPRFPLRRFLRADATRSAGRDKSASRRFYRCRPKVPARSARPYSRPLSSLP